MADELWQLSGCDVAEGIRQKRFSCLEVMEAVTGRIRALNPGLNATSTTTLAKRSEARPCR